MTHTKKLLAIADSDCSGGVGIQADLKTFAAHGTFGTSAIVSVVAEDTCEVLDVQDISPDMVKQQVDAVFQNISTDAVKIGILSRSDCMLAVTGKLCEHRPNNVVIDPVVLAKNDCPLMQPDSMDTLIHKIVPLADPLIPDISEAGTITGLAIHSPEDAERATKKIHTMGAKGILVEDDHADGDALDILFDGERFYRFSETRIQTKNTHGTGCTYSSAIACNLALGCSMEEAVRKTKVCVTTAIRHSLAIDKGCGPTHHLYDLCQNGLQEREGK